jgi:hypothetical protein
MDVMTQRYEPVEPKRTAVFDVRSSAHDVDAFVDQIADLLQAEHPVIIDLSHHDEHGNLIPLDVDRNLLVGDS